jgi:glyoxylase-like metal-dependent hydrolase (beta-lactamase superfamily II)
MLQLGNLTLHTIETGRFALDGGAMFGIVPKPLWERKIAPDARNRIPMHMRCLLVEAGDRLVLIDNGLGDKYDVRFADLYAVDQSALELHASLRRAGFAAEDVTDVVLTHLHFDHCGGSTRRKGDRLEVVFSNAVHHVQRDHWEWTKIPNPRERNSFLTENLEPLGASGQLRFLQGRTTILPGIEVFPVAGHTVGMQLVRVGEGRDTLVYVADLLPTHAHLPPAWNMAYDLFPLETIREKASFLAEVEAGGWKLFFEHDPTVEMAGLVRTETGLQIDRPRSLEAF